MGCVSLSVGEHWLSEENRCCICLSRLCWTVYVFEWVVFGFGCVWGGWLCVCACVCVCICIFFPFFHWCICAHLHMHKLICACASVCTHQTSLHTCVGDGMRFCIWIRARRALYCAGFQSAHMFPCQSYLRVSCEQPPSAPTPNLSKQISGVSHLWRREEVAVPTLHSLL